MKRDLVLITVFFALISWQCYKNDQGNRDLSLKESIDNSVAKINTAFEKISHSKGYQLLTVTETSAKTDYVFHDSINLDLIAGIYDFKPDTQMYMHHHEYFPHRLFSKSGTSDKFIVNLPQKLILHPKHLHFIDYSDSVFTNDFRITASVYHFYYTWWNTSDYKLVSDFSLNSENIGNLSISSSRKSDSEGKYVNNFTFPEGYSVIKMGQYGDTTKMIFALAKQNDTLLMENLNFTGEGFKRKEKEYVLSIGNVDIKRSTGIDSIQVFLDGVLQQKAGAKIIDSADYNSSVCHKRDILLTFDDGTTAKLSDLIAPALDTLKSLAQSLGEMYISKHIIDFIAFSVYYNNH